MRNEDCPSCGTSNAFDDSASGKMARCKKPTCRHAWRLGSSSALVVRSASLVPQRVEPQYRVERLRGAVVAVPSPAPAKLPALPDWFEAPHGFGKMIRRVDTTPDVAELHLLDVVCSHSGRMNRQTFAKTRLGHPFRLVDNGDAESYLRLARANGCRISEGTKGTVLRGDFDWSNWQCPACGHGEIAGDVQNFFWCQCGAMNCASSVLYPRGAHATGVCGSCGHTNALTHTLDTMSATKHLAHNRP